MSTTLELASTPNDRPTTDALCRHRHCRRRRHQSRSDEDQVWLKAGGTQLRFICSLDAVNYFQFNAGSFLASDTHRTNALSVLFCCARVGFCSGGSSMVWYGSFGDILVTVVVVVVATSAAFNVGVRWGSGLAGQQLGGIRMWRPRATRLNHTRDM